TKPGDKRIEPDPAEKQIYRPEYVEHHFVHYSLVTKSSLLNKEDTLKKGLQWTYKTTDPFSRFSNERTEALMLHAKAVAPHETNLWEKACLGSFKGRYACRLGNPFPANVADGFEDNNGIKYNCYVNDKIERQFLQQLLADLKDLSQRDSFPKDLVT
ncbi:MAG: hypothetical protein SGILL_007400, partial [Bacillariaceae sp.]